MYRPLILLLLLFIRFSCKDDQIPDPCENVSCAGDTLNRPFTRIMLIDPVTKHDKVYGPYASIPPDSVKYKGPKDAAFIPIEQRPDWAPGDDRIIVSTDGPVYIYIGKAGKSTVIKLTYKFVKTCCLPTLTEVTMNDKQNFVLIIFA